jgi:hypothetical protein
MTFKAIRKLGSAVLASKAACTWQVLRQVRLSRGYNHFFYTTAGLLPADPYTSAKAVLLTPCLSALAKDRTVLDLGSANGYFSLLAGQLGAKSVLGIERDIRLGRTATKAAKYLRLDQVRFENGSIYDLDSRYRRQVVLALAIVHWFAHTTRPAFGDIESVVSFLDSLVEESLIVEYVAPDDPTFLQDPALRDSPGLDIRRFGIECLEGSLGRRFRRVQRVGAPRPTRLLLVATR